MSIIKSNIENLTSLWQTVSEPFNSFFSETDFNYSFIKNSEWPNRLWFNQEINNDIIILAKDKIIATSPSLTIPYWDIYDSNSFKILQQNGFSLKFEQIGMSLKTPKKITQLNTLNLKKVSTEKEAELWSTIFSKSFGYYINPILLKNKRTNFYIAYHKNEAVGTAILHTTNNVSGIHSLGILPNQRRKGYAEQIMKLLINKSVEINSDYITLQSSNMGKGLYLKLGFEEQFVIKNYALQQRV